MNKTQLSFIMFMAILIVVVYGSCNRGNQQSSDNVQNRFVGSETCKSCHVNEYNQWTLSKHYKAMMPASDSTVLGNFNQQIYEADGVKSLFFKKGNRFYINTEGNDGSYTDFEVAYTFGVYPLQQYVVKFPKGHFQIARQSWDVQKKKWFHQSAGQKINHNDWLHWTGNAHNWNTMCSHCHSTNIKKNYDAESDSYNTTFNEVMVSCESCHGPAGLHVDLVSGNKNLNAVRSQFPNLGIGQKPDSANQINTCLPCHSLKTDIHPQLASDVTGDNFIVQNLDISIYHADGQVKEEAFELGSFLQSKMYKHGVVCTNCHNAHTSELKFKGNQLCTQCHQSKYNDNAHHFHARFSSGNQCIDCHMSPKVFMEIDERRDHSFRIPRPDQSVKYGTPNACNHCHNTKTPEWAASVITEKFGTERTYHFSDDLLAGEFATSDRALHLIRLLSDTSLPAIARSTAAGNLAAMNHREVTLKLMQATSDASAMVRYESVRALNGKLLETDVRNLIKLLSDPVRMVRIATADILQPYVTSAWSSESVTAFNRAEQENFQFLSNQLDFATGNLAMADYYFSRADYNNSIKYYKRALKKDSLLNMARLNLASSFNAIAKNDEALLILEQAKVIEPANEMIHYRLALLFAELNRNDDAIAEFEKCLALKTNNSKVYYNYGLLLQQNNKNAMAEIMLLKAFQLDNNSTDIHYALAVFYLNNRMKPKARRHVEFLKMHAPGEAKFFPLFNEFNI